MHYRYSLARCTTLMNDLNDGILFEGSDVFLKWPFKLNNLLNLNNRYKKLEHWSVGDDIAIKNYNKISKHLISILGEPSTKDEIDFIERELIWNIESIEIRLSFFEQHCYKLHFTIEKKQ